jgi:ribosomal protein S18 acetylase RimI-like enzyme
VSGFTIRRAQAEDAPAIAALMDEAAAWLAETGTTTWRPGQVDEERVLAWMTTGRVYLAVDGRAVGGVVRVAWTDEPVWGPQPPDAGYVHSLVVARSAAGQGLGRRLVSHAEEVVRASGRPTVRLDHVAGNPRLERWYTDAGYLIVGLRDRVGGDSVLLREKRIGPVS